MKTVHFAIALHNHQPVGNFDSVLEEAYTRAYLPFLEVYREFTDIPISLHLTGPLLEWLDESHPEYLDEIASLARSGSIRIIGGAFYEPILSILPERDLNGQVEMMREYALRRFGQTPGGCWLTERVWEQSLASRLSRAGVTHTIVDDAHFRTTGLREHDLSSYFITEDLGERLAVFPISEKLRYAIPFNDPQETIDHLASFATEDGNGVVVYADDGEKFGLWPRTHQQLYENGWLATFFAKLREYADYIQPIHLEDALERLPPAGRAYLPDASYREMMEWSLPAEQLIEYEEIVERVKEQSTNAEVLRYVRGGFWRNFLVKYPEAGRLYARMMHVSRKVARIPEGDQRALPARRALYRGQCNCPYWHGVFGGLYLPHLRHAVYAELSRADALADAVQGGDLRAETADFDFDGADEQYLSTSDLAVYIKPSLGGQIYCLDFRPAEFNLLNTLTRRREAYHEKVLAHAARAEHRDSGPGCAPGDHESPDMPENGEGDEQEAESIHDLVIFKDENLDKLLQYDWRQRLALVDHVFVAGVDAGRAEEDPLAEAGDFCNGAYDSALEGGDNRKTVVLTRAGTVRTGEAEATLRIEKRVCVSRDFAGLLVSYRLSNTGSQPVDAVFGSEWNFSMLGGEAVDRFFRSHNGENLGNMSARLDLGNAPAIGVVDEWDRVGVTLRFEQPARVWTYPVRTVSQSEGGFEGIYQCSAVVPTWPLRLEPGLAAAIDYRLELEHLPEPEHKKGARTQGAAPSSDQP